MMTPGELALQTEIDNLKLVIQAHGIPASAVATFPAQTIRKLIDFYNFVDHDANGFISAQEILDEYHSIRVILQLPQKEGDVELLRQKLHELDFSGDGTLDLREFLFFVTYIRRIEEDESLVLCEHFATTTSAHGLGRVVNEENTARRLLYLFAFLIALGCFVLFTTVFIRGYRSYSVTSSTTMITNTSITAPRITICSASYMRCDCELFYDATYSQPPYNLKRYQCIKNATHPREEEITFNAAKCGGAISVANGISVETVRTALIEEMNNHPLHQLSETSLLHYARHPFVPQPVDLNVGADNRGKTVLESDSILLDCLYRGKSCLKADDWKIFLDYRHGVCAEFIRGQTLGSPLPQMLKGIDGGMRVILRAHAQSMAMGGSKWDLVSGLKIFVDSPLVPSAISSDADGIMVGVGTKTDINFDITHIDDTGIYEGGNRLYSTCSINKEAGLAHCQSKCLIGRMRLECKCQPLENQPIDNNTTKTITGGGPTINGVDVPDPSESALPLCSMSKDLGFHNSTCQPSSKTTACCGLHQYYLSKAPEKGRLSTAEVEKGGGLSNAEICLEQCQIPCNRLLYKTSTRTTSWPSTTYTNALKQSYLKQRNNPSSIEWKLTHLHETLTSELVLVSIYPSTTNVFEIENSVAFTIFQLFGSIGGTLGLFIGFSIITVVELIDFIVRFCWIITKKTSNYAVEESKVISESIGITRKNTVHHLETLTKSVSKHALSMDQIMNWKLKKEKNVASESSSKVCIVPSSPPIKEVEQDRNIIDVRGSTKDSESLSAFQEEQTKKVDHLTKSLKEKAKILKIRKDIGKM
jgi:hypothetical protein